MSRRPSFLGLRSASKLLRKALGDSQNPAQDALGTLRRVVPRDVSDDVFQVALNVFGENDLKAHQSSVTGLARSRLATSASGFTLPWAICWLLSASIFSNASVSWVCS